jgi:hypothetical protein
MEKKQFEKIMDDWLSHEVKSSPELSPRDEMYRRLREKRKSSRKWFLGPIGWTAAATAAAAVLLLVIFLPDISKRMPLLKEPASALEEGKTADELVAGRTHLATVEREKMEEAVGAGAFNQLYFQQQNRADKSIVGVDIQTQRDKKVDVAPAENYRLQVQLNQVRYVYVYQFGSDQKLNRLFPNVINNIEQNPLQGGPLYNFPAPPKWFPVDEATEAGTIYVIAAEKPMQDWDQLYDQYINFRGREEKRQEIARQFLDELESVSAQNEAGIEIQKFVLLK